MEIFCYELKTLNEKFDDEVDIENSRKFLRMEFCI